MSDLLSGPAPAVCGPDADTHAAPLLGPASARLKAAVRGTSPARRLWTICLVERRALWRLAFFQTLQVLSFLPFTIATQYLIDDIFPWCQSHQRWWPVLVFLLANAALWPVHAWFTVRAFGENQIVVRSTIARLRRLVVDQLQRLSLSFFTSRGAGALSNQLTVDLARVEGFLAGMADGFIVSIVMGVSALAWLLATQPFLCLIALLGVPVQVWILNRMYARLDRLNEAVQASNEGFASRIVEFIAGMRQTKSFGNEAMMARRFGGSIEQMRTTGQSAAIAARWLNMWIQMVWQFAGTVLWCVGILAMLDVVGVHVDITMGKLIAFMGLFGFVQAGFTAIPSMTAGWAQAGPGMRKLVEVLDSDELEEYGHAHRPVALRGAISFASVNFRYPRSERAVLHAVSVDIPAGQRVGLVGETGAGKSTFLDLVLGFYGPDAGEVRFDGLPLAEIGRRQLRRATAIMTQDAFLWNDSIRENIRFGRPDASDAEVEAAARRAQAHDFIAATDHGYGTIVGERGGRLSGGQRQRIALARVFLRDPRIIVLDEPTSALDLETEARLQDDLDAMCHGRTTFIVAHRLSTLRGVDRILVFADGRVVEDGAPAELLARTGGHFARLHALQAGLAR